MEIMVEEVVLMSMWVVTVTPKVSVKVAGGSMEHLLVAS